MLATLFETHTLEESETSPMLAGYKLHSENGPAPDSFNQGTSVSVEDESVYATVSESTFDSNDAFTETTVESIRGKELVDQGIMCDTESRGVGTAEARLPCEALPCEALPCEAMPCEAIENCADDKVEESDTDSISDNAIEEAFREISEATSGIPQEEETFTFDNTPTSTVFTPLCEKSMAAPATVPTSYYKHETSDSVSNLVQSKTSKRNKRLSAVSVASSIAALAPLIFGSAEDKDTGDFAFPDITSSTVPTPQPLKRRSWLRSAGGRNQRLNRIMEHAAYGYGHHAMNMTKQTVNDWSTSLDTSFDMCLGDEDRFQLDMPKMIDLHTDKPETRRGRTWARVSRMSRALFTHPFNHSNNGHNSHISEPSDFRKVCTSQIVGHTESTAAGKEPLKSQDEEDMLKLLKHFTTTMDESPQPPQLNLDETNNLTHLPLMESTIDLTNECDMTAKEEGARTQRSALFNWPSTRKQPRRLIQYLKHRFSHDH